MKGTVFQRKQKGLYKKVYKCGKQGERVHYIWSETRDLQRPNGPIVFRY